MKSLKNEVQFKDAGFKNPRRLKSLIDKIEWKIQTEVMSFKKEQELTKEKKLLEAELNKNTEFLRKYNNFKKNQDNLRNELSQKLNAKNQYHDVVVNSAKKADELRNEIQKLSDEIEKKKKLLDELREESDKIKERIAVLKGEIKEKQEEDKKIKTEVNNASFNTKLAEIKEKLKTKKKLTTEDLLVISQASDEDISFN